MTITDTALTTTSTGEEDTCVVLRYVPDETKLCTLDNVTLTTSGIAQINSTKNFPMSYIVGAPAGTTYSGLIVP